MNMEEKVFSYIEKYNMIETGSQVIVGISGGADSVCLLFLLKKYQKRREFSLCALHVNHGIRGGEALRDQNFSKKSAKNSRYLSGYMLQMYPVWLPKRSCP